MSAVEPETFWELVLHRAGEGQGGVNRDREMSAVVSAGTQHGTEKKCLHGGKCAIANDERPHFLWGYILGQERWLGEERGGRQNEAWNEYAYR